MTDEVKKEARAIFAAMRSLAGRGPDSAINVQLLGKINQLEKLLTKA